MIFDGQKLSFVLLPYYSSHQEDDLLGSCDRPQVVPQVRQATNACPIT